MKKLLRAARTCLMCLVPLLPLAASAAAADSPAAQEYTLDNGLRLIVKPDHRAPVVVAMVWYRVGSVDESYGVTGVAHVLEHMMFKGTKQVPAGEFSRRVAAAGGRENAFTSQDATAYFQTLGRSHLPLAFQLEADRMAHLTLAPQDFAREIRVVMEERRWRIEDQARATLFEQLNATALKANAYRNPVIGWMNDLENMSADDARAFYDRWYVPNNALVIVVGDVDPPEVLALARQTFGAVVSRPLPERKPQAEPEQKGLQRMTVKAPAELPFVVMAYRAPVLHDTRNDWEPYAMEVLADVLDGNPAARLNRNLVRTERVASSVDVSYDNVSRGPGMFYVTATPATGRTPQELEQALRRELQRIAIEGVDAEELQRVKAQAVAAHVYERDSMFFQARQIGGLEMAGLSYRDIDLLLEKLKAVTADQVQAVAKKYFLDDHLTIAYLDPQPVSAQRKAAPPAGARHGE